MALFSFLRLGLVLLLIGLFSPFTKNGFSSQSFIATVNAARYITSYPRLEIIKFAPSKVKFKDPHSYLMLPCTPSETENILVTWYRNNEILKNFRRNEFQIYQNGSLRLPANEKANGAYRCFVNGTKLDMGSLFSNLTTVEYPVLKRRNDVPTNLTALIGEHFTLDCPILSIPSASISWLFNNASISNFITINDKNSFIQLNNGSLVIKIIKETNKGRYKCIARNNFATKSHRQSIINLATRKFLMNSTNSYNIKLKKENQYDNRNYEKLIPELQENIQYVRSGNNLTLYCDTYKQDIKIAWTFRPIWSNKTFEIANHTDTILIYNATVDSHEGIYNCSTKTDHQIIEVVVTIPPVIDNPLISYEKQIANIVSLNCTASGKPEPAIFWYRDGILLENNYTININSSNLKINSFDDTDSGIYQCFARNLAGETSSTSYLDLKHKDIEVLPERPCNVQCFPINYRLMNVTFESNHHIETININMARKNPPEWFAQFPLDTTQKQFLLTQNRYIFEPFMLYLRTIVLTGYKKFISGKEEKHVEPSLLSEGVMCATQGLEIHPVFFPNGIYIWWHYETFKNIQKIKIDFLVIQFYNDEETKNLKENSTQFPNELVGTREELLNTERKYIEDRLEKIPVLTQLPNSNNFHFNDPQKKDITNLIVSGDVTGILIPNTTKLKVRVIAITEANKNFRQDFRYMEWKNIKRQSKQFAVPMIQSINSRSINFKWDPLLASNISCVTVCYQSTNLSERWINNKEICLNLQTTPPKFTIDKLKPKWSIEFTFSDCETKQIYGSISEIVTLADPPGPISNFRIFKNDGYKLIWDEPVNPNGKIIAYLIEWTVNNTNTYRSNVTAFQKYYQLPNITEYINISVRAYGEHSLGLPIYVDLKNNIESIQTENTDYFDPIIGIAIGLFLSLICISFFIFLYIYQRKYFKTRFSSPSGTSLNQYPQITAADISQTAINGSELTTRHNRISPTKVFNTNSAIINRNSANVIQSSKVSTAPDSSELCELQNLIPHQTSLNLKSCIDRTTILTPSTEILTVSQNGDAIAYYYRNDNEKDEEYENEVTCAVALCSSTPLPERSKNGNSTGKNLLQRNHPVSLIPTSFKFRNKKNKNENHNFNKTSSSPDFNTNDINLKENINSKTFNTNQIDCNLPTRTNVLIGTKKLNGSLRNVSSSLNTKTKHSTTLSEVTLSNLTDSKYPCNKTSNFENKIHTMVDSNSNTTPMEINSHYIKLIDDNNSSCDKNFSQNSTNNESSNLSNCTTITTFLNSEDNIRNEDGADKREIPDVIIKSNTGSGKIYFHSKEEENGIKSLELNNKILINDKNRVCKNEKKILKQVKWNHRRPIIDQNG